MWPGRLRYYDIAGLYGLAGRRTLERLLWLKREITLKCKDKRSANTYLYSGLLNYELAYSAELIADYFLTQTDNLTPMHMIKMTYIAHGYTLAILKEPLIKSKVQAWKYGPVIPVLYHAYKAYGSEPINALGYCNTHNDTKEFEERKSFIDGLIDPDAHNILEQIAKIYGPMSALQLSALTHQKGTPWAQCYIPDRFFTIIPNSIIQEFYENKMKDANHNVGC